MLGDADIGGQAFAEAEAELAQIALSKVPLSARLAAVYKRSWGCMFKMAGADIVFRREIEGGPPLRVNTKAFFRPLMEKEIAGEIVASDMGVLIDPAPLLAAGVEWPTRKGDKLVRNAGRPAENLFTAVAEPAHLDVSGQDVVIRMIVRG